MANGMPSRRLQISLDRWPNCSSVTAKSGRNPAGAIADRSIASSTDRQRRHQEGDFAGDPERFAAGHEQPSARAERPGLVDHRAGQASRRCSQLSSTISIRRSPTNRSSVSHGRAAGLVGQSERTRDRDRHHVGMR